MKEYKWVEYLGVVALWIVIFWKNVFSNLLFVDYMPVREGYLIKSLVVGNYTNAISVIHILRGLFSWVGAEGVFFSITILLGMLVSYYYISKLMVGKKRFLFAFVFFFSPFVYTRLMIGQLGIIIAYLLIPMFLVYLFELFERDLDYRSLLKVVLSMTLIGAMTPHFFVLEGLMFLIGSFWFYFYKNKYDVGKYLKILGIFVLLLLLMNIYWIQGTLAGGVLGEIGEEHSQFFAPKASVGVSAIAKVLTGWGFWREQAFERAYMMMPAFVWYVLLIGLVALFLVGYYADGENKKSKFFYTLFWFGLILGVGISHPYTSGIFEALFKNLPFFNGFRDSHKFVALIVLAYAYFLPQAVAKINKKLGVDALKVLVVVLFVGLIVALNFQMIGLHNQVKNVKYPEAYEEANVFFDSRDVNGHIIFLPWEGYLTYSWSENVSSDGRIGAFATGYFDKIVLTGPDYFGGNTGSRLEISECLEANSTECLKELGVAYVMKDTCAIYPEEYLWLGNETEFENECLEIYYIGGEAEPNRIPARFYVSLIISLLTLIYIAYALGSGRWRKGRAARQIHRLKTI